MPVIAHETMNKTRLLTNSSRYAVIKFEAALARPKIIVAMYYIMKIILKGYIEYIVITEYTMYCEFEYHLGTSSIDDLVLVNIETAYDPMIETPHHL